MMDAAVVAALSKGGWGAATVLVAMIAIKIIDKYRGRVDRKRESLGLASEERASYEQRLSSLGAELDKQREKLSVMEARLEQLTRERHRFYDAIVRCCIEHPTTTDWWRQEMAKLPGSAKQEDGA